MRRVLSRKPSPAMAVAFIALLAALSGSAIALPGKNTVDSGDIKKNAVRTQDIRNGNVTTKDVKNNNLRSIDIRNNTLTGNDINEGSLGQVPSANSANTANTANSANSAGTANVANSLSPPEAYREVGSAGNPAFGDGCANSTSSPFLESVAFFKDHDGVVHFRGVVECSGVNTIAFQLPAGYRPRNGKIQVLVGASGAADQDSQVLIAGAGVDPTVPDGAVVLTVAAGEAQALDGLSFRAEG
jgi:hypothetical protein